MSRREQPYIPLYAQDFLTDEKLRECSAASVGVYIMLMCVMHKQEEYGTILLREKDRQSGDIIQDFARKLEKHLPFDVEVIGTALQELLDENVIQQDGDRILQKRMVRDADVSEKRSAAGRKGSTATNTKFAAAKASANTTANPEEDPELAKAVCFYLDRVNPTASHTSIEELAGFVKQMGADVCIYAMEYALDERKAKWSYIKGVLQGYNRDGIRNMEDLKRAAEEHAKRKQEATPYATDKRSAGGHTTDWRTFKPSGGFKGQ